MWFYFLSVFAYFTYIRYIVGTYLGVIISSLKWYIRACRSYRYILIAENYAHFFGICDRVATSNLLRSFIVVIKSTWSVWDVSIMETYSFVVFLIIVIPDFQANPHEFLEKQMTVNLPVHLVYTLSIQCSLVYNA